jgi:hypothetical protein
MISKKIYSETLIITITISMLWPKQSLAYLDPGSGSYMIQMFLAATVGFGYIFRNYIKQLKNLFKKHDKVDKK